jgi:GDPmannose 4,6-dehydratase
VREFIELAFAEVGRSVAWKGKGESEIGRDALSGQVLVRIDPRYFRPTEVDLLLGNPAKAKRVLGWEHKVGFHDLVKMMVKSDLDVVRGEHAGLKGRSVVPGQI